MVNLDNYSADPADGKVVAWPIEHTRPGTNKESKREIKVTIKAQVLKAKPAAEASKAEGSKDEL